jgi:hypothetical protein
MSFFLIGLLACKDEFDNVSLAEKVTLPEYSQTGKGNIGCLVNDQVWTTFGKHFERGVWTSYWKENYTETSSYLYYHNQEILNVSGRMSKVHQNQIIYDTQLGFSLVFTDSLAGQYQLGADSTGSMSFQDLHKLTYYQTHSKNPLLLTIRKFSMLDKIVSGEFEGYLFNKDNLNDSIKVSQGRFDVKI